MIYFIRHGQADYSEKDSKIYQGFGNHMAPLSPRGIQEIEETAADPRLHQAKLILSSPYVRALQSAAILSRRLQLPLQVETDLHEWLADKRYHYLSEEQAARHYKEFVTYKGFYPDKSEKTGNLSLRCASGFFMSWLAVVLFLRSSSSVMAC